MTEVIANRNHKACELAEAIEVAIKSCVKRNILVYFLEKHASEVLNMLFTEWNLDDALEVKREETLEEVFALLRQGYSIDEAEKMLTPKLRHEPLPCS